MIPIRKNLGIKCFFAAVLSVSISVLILIAGCGKTGGKTDSGEKIILASFYPVYIAALNVTENIPGIRLVNMAPPATGCLHDYQLTPADAALLEKAAVLIVNGGGMESFLEKAASLNKQLIVINASEEIEFISSCEHGHNNDEHNEHGHHKHHNHNKDDNNSDGHAHVNSHVWLGVDNYVQQVKTIAKHLSAWDSANSTKYTANAQTFADSLQEFKTAANEKLSNISNKKIAIFHEGFVYFANDFGLTVAAVIEREPGVEPSAAEVISDINTIKRAGVKALFTEPQYASAAAKTISAETGLPLFTLDPVVSGPIKKEAYINAMRKNIETLKKALE